MDVLDYMERESAETMREMMRDYAASFDRAVRVTAALAGGAAALVSYAPSAAMPSYMRWVLLGVAGVWGVAAGCLALHGTTSNFLQSGASVRAMQDRYLVSGGVLSPYDGGKQDAMVQVRLAELNRRHAAIEDYKKALGKRARVLNRAILCAATAPAAGVLLAVIFSISSS